MRLGAVWLACFAAPALAGLPLAFARPFGWLSFGGRLSLAAAVGWFSTSLAMTAASLFGLRWSLVGMILAGLALTAFLAAGLAGEKPIRLARDDSHARARVVGWLLCTGAVFVSILAVIAGAATSADLIVFWGSKSEAFALARGIDVAVLKDPLLQYLHTFYPPLLTNVYALATIGAGRLSWLAATATFPLTLAALSVGLASILRLSTSPGRAAVVTAATVCGLGLLGNEADVAGNAEMPLLIFEALAMSLLIAPAAARPSVQRLAGCLLGGAACTKVEGLPFVAAAVVAFVLLRRSEISPGRALLRLTGPAVAGLGLWFALGARHHLFLGYRGYGELLVLHWGSLGAVLKSVAWSLWLVGYGIAFLVPAALALTRMGSRRPALLPLLTAAALASFFLFTYLHQADARLWIDWSAARIFAALIPLLALSAVAPAWSREGEVRDAPPRRAAAGLYRTTGSPSG